MWLKNSEARIIIFLQNTRSNLHGTTHIVHKLNMDYRYVSRTLTQMLMKKWLTNRTYDRQLYWNLTITAPLNMALKKLGDDKLEKD